MTNKDLQEMGMDLDGIRSFSGEENYGFDPTGKIVNEVPGNRGAWAATGGKDAIFTLKLQNCTSNTQRAEIFGAARSIVEIPNDSQYSQNGTGVLFRPFTTEQVLCLIGIVATTAEASEGTIQPPSMVIYDDRNGNLVYIETGYRSLTDWAATFTSQNPLTALTAGVTMIISCGQRSYRSLMSDLRDLVLLIRSTKIIYPDEDGKNNPIELYREKSFGGADSNTIEPSEYFEPENQQSKIIRIPDRYFVDKLTTLYTDINGSGTPGVPAQPVAITFSVTAYQNNGTAFNPLV